MSTKSFPAHLSRPEINTVQTRTEAGAGTLPFLVETPKTVSVHRPIGTLACLLAADIFGITVSLLLSALVRNYIIPNQVHSVGNLLPPVILITLTTFTVAGLYPGVGMHPVEELRRGSVALLLSFAATWAATFLLHDFSSSRVLYGFAFLVSVFAVPLSRAMVRQLFCRRSWWGSQVAILGLGDSGQSLVETLLRSPQIGLKSIAVLDDDASRYRGLDLALDSGSAFALSGNHG